MRFLLALLLLCPSLLFAQLAAYNDSRDQFVIFDAGEFHDTEPQPAKEIKVSNRYVAYIDNQEDFKVYDQGKVHTLEQNRVSQFYCTDDLVVYEVSDQVYVYRDGWKKLISIASSGYSVNDSVVVFYDGYQRKLVVYNDGRLRAIADGILDDPIRQFKTGSDLVAFLETATLDFNVYWNRHFYTLIHYVDMVDFQAGAGTVAYIDTLTGEFKVFYQGTIQTLEPFRPKSYQVANGLVAYVTIDGTFKVFDNGSVTELQNFAPEHYRTEQDLVTYSTLDEIFKVYWHGQTYRLAGFVPVEHFITDGMVVFTNQQQQVAGFYRGQSVLFSSATAKAVSIQGQAIVVHQATDHVKIIIGEQEYERNYIGR